MTSPALGPPPNAAMGRIEKFLGMIQQSRLLAPNLKTMTLTLYTGNAHRGNAVARCVAGAQLPRMPASPRGRCSTVTS